MSFCSIKRSVREFHIVVMEWRQRTVLKKCAPRAVILFCLLNLYIAFLKLFDVLIAVTVVVARAPCWLRRRIHGTDPRIFVREVPTCAPKLCQHNLVLPRRYIYYVDPCYNHAPTTCGILQSSLVLSDRITLSRFNQIDQNPGVVFKVEDESLKWRLRSYFGS